MYEKTSKIKNKLKQNKRFTQKKSKIYGADKYEKYTIHKATLISYDPTASCNFIKKVFKNAISGCKSPPDYNLKKRGVRWVRFLTGGKAEIHFVPPFHLKHDKVLKKMVRRNKNRDPLKTQFFENHVGIYVPDLTPIIISLLRMKIPCHLNKRADGMYQLYFAIEGCLDYLDIDSIKIDFNKISKIDPDFRAYTFDENTNLIRKYEQDFISREKKRKEKNTKLYIDPKHNSAPRRITFKKNGVIKIRGRDTPKGKIWTINGKIDKNKNAILDFSSKGGPKNVTAKFTNKSIKFNDGNHWQNVYHI